MTIIVMVEYQLL